ncbi:MAG TPA: hypothetical protein VEP66_07800 [Myxococcales bacterium]|nr:hypothetical protein [Myxococcales bacterium]
MMTRLPRLLFCALFLVACKTGSPNTMLGAATTTALALGASAANRAAGGCYAICTAGTACNTNTGLCDRLACDGKCAADERCEETFAGGKCVPGGTGIATKANGSGVALPVGPIYQAPDSNHAAPTIVPAAEQRDPPK